MYEEPARKKKSYFVHFQDNWMNIEIYKKWLIKLDDFTAQCSKCNVKFTVKHDGEKAVKKHYNSENHKKTSNTIATNSLLTEFMPSKGI